MFLIMQLRCSYLRIELDVKISKGQLPVVFTKSVPLIILVWKCSFFVILKC